RDYVRRAMPWNAPKSLTNDEVYAVVAYMLHLGDILPGDFVLSNRNIAEVQARLPNRDGMTLAHGLGDVHGKPDVASTACMKNCATEVRLASVFPDWAHGSHGDLAQQNRALMATRAATGQGAADLAKRQGCLACHGIDQRTVGPAFRDVARKYKGDAAAASHLEAKVRQGGSGAWGPVAMPALPDIEPSELTELVRWVLGL
ncbi:MAG TPA: c-type cytochrome, partial [Usitatibacter sp.]|nr:c-type cytochrome [Usitatibacter sp.]